MNAIGILKHINEHKLLYSNEGGFPLHQPSNSELKRWLDKGNVWCNGKVLQTTDEVEFPITQLIINWKSKRRVTLIWDDGTEEYWSIFK